MRASVGYPDRAGRESPGMQAEERIAVRLEQLVAAEVQGAPLHKHQKSMPPVYYLAKANLRPFLPVTPGNESYKPF